MAYNNSTPHSFRHGAELLWPYPWLLSVPPTRPPHELIAEDNDYIVRQKTQVVNYTPLRSMGLFRRRDTPLRAIYRLYEWLCTNSINEIMEETWYFFNMQPTWVLKDIKDPKDPDPIRYAILAAVVELLVLSFNKKIKLGLRRGITTKKPLMVFEFKKDPNPPYEEAPPWCAEVPGPSETFRSRPRFMYTDLEPLYKRNLLVDATQFWNF